MSGSQCGVFSELPSLSAQPKHFPNYCLSLSLPFVTALAQLLPRKPSKILSIGSGTGLLEALLQRTHNELHVEGVEVSTGINQYLPPEGMHIVGGTWDCCTEALLASAWLFVYPREPRLVSEYIRQFSQGTLESVIWLGPRQDWADFEACFEQPDLRRVHLIDVPGLASYELMVIMEKLPAVMK